MLQSAVLNNLLKLATHALLALAVLSQAACGGGGGGETKKPPPKNAEQALNQLAGGDAAKAGGGLVDGYVVLGENAKWRPIKGLFDHYTKEPIDGVVNWSLDNTTKVVEWPKVPEQAVVEENGGTDERPADLPDTCATKGPIERYTLFMIMTGVAQPKAVFTDPDGGRCDVVRGDALGNDGARVTAITQYKVIVSVPGKEKPLTLSLAPPISVGDPGAEELGDVP
jgi:hypothetical protein